MRRRRARLAAAACLALAAPVADRALASAGARVLLLPAESASADIDAPSALEASLAEALSRRGWEVVRGEPLERELRRARIRRTDSLSAERQKELLTTLDAKAVLFSAVASWRTVPEPLVALSARLVSAEGALLWSELAGSTASASEGALGLRRPDSIEELAQRVAERLVVDLPGPGGAVRAPERPSRPMRLARPPTYRSRQLGTATRRVALLPLANLTRASDAPRAAGVAVARRVAASEQFELVEPAELRAALLAERIPSIRHFDPKRLRALGERLGTSCFLRGTVWRWREGVPGAIAGPEVELQLELVDVAAGEVLFATHGARSGADYAGLFLRGAIGSGVALADRLVGEMLEALAEAEPAGPARPLTAAAHDLPSQLEPEP